MAVGYTLIVLSVIECSRVNISVKTIISIIIVAHMCVHVLLVYIMMLCRITDAVFLDLFANLLFVFFTIFYRYKDNSDVFTNANSNCNGPTLYGGKKALILYLRTISINIDMRL